MLLPDADFALEQGKKMPRGLPFLDEHFARGKPPLFGPLDANLIFILQVRKEGDLAKQGNDRFAFRDLCAGPQNRFRY
jgi:hypothetical protein